MDWKKASDLIWKRFSQLDGSDQIDTVEKSLSGNVIIFRTISLDGFCKHHMNGDVLTLAKAVSNGKDWDSFGADQLWCLYDEEGHSLTTRNTPLDFLEDDDEYVFFAVVVEDVDLLKRLGFSSYLIKEIQKAYAEI